MTQIYVFGKKKNLEQHTKKQWAKNAEIAWKSC